jgi:predicted  nucleic acid-binding Zn-ribbon protein
VNFLTTGWRELERKFQRAADRLRLRREEKKLAAAEIYLGELGWQQADFPPEVEAQIRAITSVEHQQAQFSNQSADIQSDIDEIQTRREQKRLEHAAEIDAIESELQPLAQARETAREPLAGLQEGIRRFEQAIAAVRKTKEELEPQIRELHALHSTSIDVQGRLTHLRDKQGECDFEIDDLQRAAMKLQNEIKAQTQAVAALDLQIQDLNMGISHKRDALNAADAELLAEIGALQHGKSETGRIVNKLDRKKSPAFLAVGQCLADFSIAPMNQPEALQNVWMQRETVRGCRERIEESMAASSQTSRVALRVFYIFLILLIAAAAFAAFRFKAPRHVRAGKPPAGFYAESPWTREAHSPMTATCAATRRSSANSEGVSMVKVRLE